MEIQLKNYHPIQFWTNSEENTLNKSNQSKESRSENEEDWLIRILFKEIKPLQNLIYQKLFFPTAEAYVKEYLSNPNTTDSDKARFSSGSFEHAGKCPTKCILDEFARIQNSHENAIGN